MAIINPFAPSAGTGQLITTSGSSQVVTLAQNDSVVRVTNYGATNPAYIRVGMAPATGSLTATTADMVIFPNSYVNIWKGEMNALAALQLTGATTLQIMTGTGGI